MSDTSPYGVTQHADAAMTTADALVGERVSPVVGNSLVGSPATFSTAPYVPPGTGLPSRVGRCVGKEGCLAYPVVGTDTCVFHTPGWRGRWVDKEVSDQPPDAA